MEREYQVTHAPELETLRNQHDRLAEIETCLQAGVFDNEKQRTDMLYRRIVLRRSIDSTLSNPTTSERAEEVAAYSVSQIEQVSRELDRIPEKNTRLREKAEERKSIFQERLGTIALVHTASEGRLKISQHIMDKVFAIVDTPENATNDSESQPALRLDVKLNPSNVTLNGSVYQYSPERGRLSRARQAQRRAAVELLITSGEQYTFRELWDYISSGKPFDKADAQSLRQWLNGLQVEGLKLVSRDGVGRGSKLMLNPIFEVAQEDKESESAAEHEQAVLEKEQAKEVIKLTDDIRDYMPELYTLAAQMQHYTELFEYFGKPVVDQSIIDNLENAIEEMRFQSDEELVEYRKYSFEKLEALLKDTEAYTNLIDNTSLRHPGIDMLVVLAPHLKTQSDRSFLSRALNSTRTSREIYRQGRSVKVLEFMSELGHVIYSVQQESNA